jgi:iron-sulfur cluster assembly accessory protein
MISVTEKAARKVKELLAREQRSPEQYGLRLGVMGGGCSGLQYVMEFDVPQPDDQVVVCDGAKVLVDPRSMPYLEGSQLQYVESLMGAGFKVVNPNEKGSCGCGHSFTV